MKVLDGRGFSARAEVTEGREPDLSVIIPICDEEDSILPLHRQLSNELARLHRTYEVVFVDDGSRDASAARLRELAESDPHVVVVQFRRNFGQTAALQAGIDLSRGNVLVFMDGDLQNDPKDIARLLDKIDEGNDVVSGWRKDRHDPLVRRKVPSWIANWLISRVTGVRLNDYGCTLKAYRREVLSDVRLYGEMHRFIPAYASWTGAEANLLFRRVRPSAVVRRVHLRRDRPYRKGPASVRRGAQQPAAAACGVPGDARRPVRHVGTARGADHAHLPRDTWQADVRGASGARW